MLILTLFLSVVLSVWGGRLLFRRTKSYVVYLFEVMFLLFFVVRPFSLTFLGGASFDLKRFGIGDGPVLTYSLCGLIFSAVFHFAVFRLYGRRRLFSDRMLRFCDFDDVSNGRFAFVFLVFVLITYVANVVKFHSFVYFARNLDSFFAGVNLEGGLWFVQTLSWILIFPLVAFVGKSLDIKLWKLVATLAWAMIMFTVVAKPSARTETIALLMAVAIYMFSMKKIRVNVLAVGLLVSSVILMLVFLDIVRQGEAPADAKDGNVSSVLLSAYQNVGPADNGMILIDYLSVHPWLYFKYLAPSLLPTSLVPHALVPFKPRTDIEGVLTYSIFGFDLDPLRYHEGGTLTYTVPAAGYADLGFIGVAIAALIYSFMFTVFLRGWRLRSRSGRFTTLYFLVLLIAGFRLSDEALLDTFYWTLVAVWLLHVTAHFRFLAPAAVSAKERSAVDGSGSLFHSARSGGIVGAGG